MPVKRLSPKALEQLLDGRTREAATCVVKFYSNTCDMCHNLKEYYETLSEDQDYSDLYFFAFNIADRASVQEELQFKGTPTIALLQVPSTPQKPRIRVMPDPEEPNQQTWYKIKDIRNFIEKEK